MTIELTAHMRPASEFFEMYRQNPVDVNSVFDGMPLLMDALANNDPESRFAICIFLLDKGANAHVMNDEKETPLHFLFSAPQYNFEQTMILFKRLLAAGADVHQQDKKKRLALHHMMNLPCTDDILMPFLELYLAQNPDIQIKSRWNMTPLELAEKVPYRKQAAERMRQYVEAQKQQGQKAD